MDELTRWVLSVDRRTLAMRALETSSAFSASEIASRSGRSVQNISRALHELEERGLVECLTPEKPSWKRYLLTPRGRTVLEDLKASELIA